ncbi:MAG: YcaO-related McrA-glycine thioamidation protein [Methanomicrobiales archaeon]|nr:YcaO-related McrA-glycine thioamidation protein [Methanomicrobiales archaeon]
MILQSCKKLYQQETHRTRSPEETYELVKDLTSPAGITRVADITGLDRIGIPVFSCIRPVAAEGAITVYNGKGATPIAARVSAIMEGLERYSAELHDRQTVTMTYDQIRSEKNAIHPDFLILPEDTKQEWPIPWYPAYDIIRNEEIWVPAHAVFHPVPRIMGKLFRTSTNGIASGNTFEEAVFHSLCEIIERDAWSLVEACRLGGPVITNITHPVAADLIEKFRAAGVDVILRDITSDLGIPTVAAVSDDTQLRDPTLLCIGMGTHLCKEIAILRALTEVAQSRATQIHGAREDTQSTHFLSKVGYDRAKRLNKKWFDPEPRISYDDMSSYHTDDFLDDIHIVIDRLKEAGLDRVLVVDLTRPEIGIPVVRVIVPGLEHYAMDPERLGERCRRARRNYLPGSKPAS